MKRTAELLVFVNREMLKVMAKTEKISIKEKSLRDAYVKTKFKQYQQIRKNIRTRHK